jgi:hypothetical protein
MRLYTAYIKLRGAQKMDIQGTITNVKTWIAGHPKTFKAIIAIAIIAVILLVGAICGGRIQKKIDGCNQPATVEPATVKKIK